MVEFQSNHYLFASDFDQALSYNDAGPVLAGLLKVGDYDKRVARLAASNLVQQGGELVYLIQHDPEFRRVRREQLVEAGRRVRLKRAIPQLVHLLNGGISGLDARFHVISAAPRDLVVSALDGIVHPDRIVGTHIDFDADTGEVRQVHNVAAGFGRVTVIDRLAAALGVRLDRVIYVGDGSSDVHAMLHVNSHYGFTVAVGENRVLEQVAQSTVISEHACSVMMPVLEQVLGWRRPTIRSTMESTGLRVAAWQKTRTDTVRLAEFDAGMTLAPA